MPTERPGDGWGHGTGRHMMRLDVRVALTVGGLAPLHVTESYSRPATDCPRHVTPRLLFD